MKGQALAIAAVIAAGVTMFVTYLSNFDSLDRTLRNYYERERFADVFANVARAPERLASPIAAIPGVALVDTRVIADVTLDVPGMPEPATGRLVSIPARVRPAAQRCLAAPRRVARSRAARRGGGERGVLRGARVRPGRPGGRHHQRPPPHAHHRRRGPVA